MSGRSKALAVLFLIAGAALAAPAPSLRISTPERAVELALPQDGRFTYRYVQSIYEAPVEERLRLEGDRFRVEGARSPDRRALEYFRWPGTPRPDGDALLLDAPDVVLERLEVRIAPTAAQALAAGALTLELAPVFGETVIAVAPARMPRIAWLVALVRRSTAFAPLGGAVDAVAP